MSITPVPISIRLVPSPTAASSGKGNASFGQSDAHGNTPRPHPIPRQRRPDRSSGTTRPKRIAPASDHAARPSPLTCRTRDRSWQTLAPPSPGYREPCKARPAARIERRRSGDDSDKLFQANAERDAAPSDQMCCATIIISSCVGALPSPMQSMTASANKGLIDRDMLRHLIAA